MLIVLATAPILLTMTLLVTGVAKLGQREGIQDAMVSLRLPARSLHPLVAAVLPVAEIVLALTLWIPVPGLQTVIAAVIAALMTTYLVIIARALTFDEVVECSCFGTLASPTVSARTLWRNVLLTVLGLLAVIAAATGLLTATLVSAPLVLLGWVLGLAVTVLLTALALGGTQGGAVTAPAGSGDSTDADDAEQTEDAEEVLDYERTAIPAAVLQRSDGSLVTLRQLSARQAALLVFVSEGCGPCERVLDRLPAWIRDLGAFMQVATVFRTHPDTLRERTVERAGDQVLHDVQFSAREALGSRGAPSAVLLGADGMLAGGPVTGGTAVIEFVDEITEQIRSALRDGELPASEDATGGEQDPVTAPTPGPSSPPP